MIRDYGWVRQRFKNGSATRSDREAERAGSTGYDWAEATRPSLNTKSNANQSSSRRRAIAPKITPMTGDSSPMDGISVNTPLKNAKRRRQGILLDRLEENYRLAGPSACLV